MRVLWLTNDPLPAVDRHHGKRPIYTGGWMPSLLEHLSKAPGVHVDVASTSAGYPDDQCSEDGVDYFTLSQPRWQPFFSHIKRDLDKLVSLVRERKPDLIHIHGTERFYGL